MSSNKYFDSLSNLLSLIKLNFSITCLNKHKIGPNTPINNISLPGSAFYFNETKSPMVEQDFFINEKYMYTKHIDLTVLLDKNLLQSFTSLSNYL